MSNTIETRYSAYVHISNSGYSFDVEVKDLDNKYGASQFLTTSLHAFGLPHSTTLYLDDNVLNALEYIVKRAREQQEAYPQLKLGDRYKVTKKADIGQPHEEVEGANTNDDTEVTTV